MVQEAETRAEYGPTEYYRPATTPSPLAGEGGDPRSGEGEGVAATSDLRRRPQLRLSERDAAFTLGYDVLQLGLLLYLTGGLENPFAILMIAPVTVAATILSRHSVIFLSALAISAITVLAVSHWPLPWLGATLALPSIYIFGIWTALVLSTIFIAAYAWSVAGEALRVRAAYPATQLVHT